MLREQIRKGSSLGEEAKKYINEGNLVPDDLILSMREALGMSIVVVTHELDSAFKIADRMTVLDRGKILFIGTPDELRNDQSERIQNLLHRRTEEDIIDPEEYLRRLTGERLDKEGHP